MVSCFAAVFSVSPGSKMSIEPIVIRDERDSPERRRAHAGQVIQPRKELLIELHQPFVFVPALLRLQPEDQEVLLIEAEVDALQVVERADEQTRANQQQQ